MIKNKEEFKNYNIVCINDKEIKECFDLLEKLGFKIDKRLLATFSVFINFNETQNLFLNTKKLESNFDKNITFYEFRKLAKKFLKEKKLEDFEVANDGRIIKVNNWRSEKIIYGINQSCRICETVYLETWQNAIDCGLIFATEEARDKGVFRMKIENQLKNIAERLNNGEKIDWDNKNQQKHYIYYNLIIKGIDDIYVYGTEVQRNIYCLSNKFLEEAKKEIGEENLVKYFKE